MPQIECKDLSLSYEGVCVMSGLTFSVNSGDYLCVVGENGSGKSTLIKALLSLKKPSGGSITFGDGLKKDEIGYLPQKCEAQKYFPASVREVVMSGTLNAEKHRLFYTRSLRELADKNMEKLGIREIAQRPFSELSGGQQQRVLLARALCATKKLLLLDEPVAGLDPVVTAELYHIIKDINSDGITIIMVSHDVKSAVEYGTHILHLHGRPLFFGSAEEYKKTELFTRYIGGCDHD